MHIFSFPLTRLLTLQNALLINALNNYAHLIRIS